MLNCLQVYRSLLKSLKLMKITLTGGAQSEHINTLVSPLMRHGSKLNTASNGRNSLREALRTGWIRDLLWLLEFTTSESVSGWIWDFACQYV